MTEKKFRHFDKRLNDFLIFELLSVGIGWFSEMESFDKDRADSPIEQFTGLKDKNGVEIYEGDIIQYGTLAKYQSSIFWSPQDFGFVTYNELLGEYTGLSFFTGYKNFEIVGNIHQNGDMLDDNS